MKESKSQIQALSKTWENDENTVTVLTLEKLNLF